MNVICKNCGSVDDYTATQNGQHLMATCNGCGKYIKFLPQNNVVPKLYFGKYKGREIASLTSEEEIQYCKWLSTRIDLKPGLVQQLVDHLKSLNRN
jgi:uncharacterized protein (DUF3820 family)